MCRAPCSTAPRVSQASATLALDFTLKDFVRVTGSGALPYPIAGDRPLLATVTVNFVVGITHVAHLVIDTHFEPSFLEYNGIL